MTLTLTLDPVIRHTVVHHSSTSTYIPNFIQIEETFCGRTDGRTDGRTFPPLILLGRLLEVDLKIGHSTERIYPTTADHRHRRGFEDGGAELDANSRKKIFLWGAPQAGTQHKIGITLKLGSTCKIGGTCSRQLNGAGAFDSDHTGAPWMWWKFNPKNLFSFVGLSPPVGCCRLQPPSPFIIITQPEN